MLRKLKLEMIIKFSLLSLTINQRCDAMQILWITVGEGSNLLKTYIESLSHCVAVFKPMFDPVKGTY